MNTIRYGIIGGSGLYAMPELTNVHEVQIDTPFGAPSDAIIVGELNGVDVAFLPRHGRGHRYTPTEVPYRANIFALKKLGVQHVIAVSACGSLKEELAPGNIVVPDQLFDYTKDERGRTFYEKGIVAHVGVADPFCADLSAVIADATAAVGGTVHRGGTLITIEGPRFSTRAESNVWRGLGMSIIGMTTSPEAFLAREAEMCYAVMSHVTDYDVWHHEPVTAEMVFKTFSANLQLAQRAVVEIIRRLQGVECTGSCANAMQGAFATHDVSREVRERLRPIIGKYYE
jgi:5'-methylthioadenosine phosphorylase